jgi:hypothetical protein
VPAERRRVIRYAGCARLVHANTPGGFASRQCASCQHYATGALRHATDRVLPPAAREEQDTAWTSLSSEGFHPPPPPPPPPHSPYLTYSAERSRVQADRRGLVGHAAGVNAASNRGAEQADRVGPPEASPLEGKGDAHRAAPLHVPAVAAPLSAPPPPSPPTPHPPPPPNVAILSPPPKL